jgi:hypothetical protein
MVEASLALTGSMFMLEVYDRALPSRSVPTLLGLLAITALMYLSLGVLEAYRAKVLTRLGSHFDFTLATAGNGSINAAAAAQSLARLLRKLIATSRACVRRRRCADPGWRPAPRLLPPRAAIQYSRTGRATDPE